jgi:hypothetical protein
MHDDNLIVTQNGAKTVCKSICTQYSTYGFNEELIWEETYKHFVGLPVGIVKHRIHRGPRGRYYPHEEIEILRKTASKRMTSKAKKALADRDKIRKLRKEIEVLSDNTKANG